MRMEEEGSGMEMAWIGVEKEGRAWWFDRNAVRVVRKSKKGMNGALLAIGRSIFQPNNKTE